MEYSQEAEIYWNNLLMRMNCNMDTISTVQMDFSNDPDYQNAIGLATPEQRAVYEDICSTCLYNLNLQDELNRSVNNYIRSHEDGVTDADLQNEKIRLEDDMKDIRKKISRKWPTFLPFIGMGFFVVDFLIMLILFIIYGFTSWCSLSDFIGGIFFFSTLFIIVSLVMMFVYLIPYDIAYNVFLAVYGIVWFMVGIMNDFGDFRNSGVALVYFIPMFAIPAVVFLSTFPFKISRRIKRDRMLEQYADDLEWYDDAFGRIIDSYQNSMNAMFADFSARKSSSEAYLYLPQEAYDYRDYLQREFTKNQTLFETKKPK